MTQEFAQRAERESLLNRPGRSPEQPAFAPPKHPLVQLGATVGNQHVARMIAQRAAEDEEDIQAKHDIRRESEGGESEDEELQAKHDIQRESEGGEGEDEEIQAKHDIQRESEGGESEDEEIQAKHDIQREGEEEELQAKHDIQREAEDEELQAKHDVQPKPEVGLEGGPVSQGIQDRINAARGNGAGLSVGFKEKMESSFGEDFSDVKVHRDTEADSLNRSITAKAFTIGSDIFLRNDVGEGDHHTLAHELTHVVQQRSGLGGGSGGGMQVGAADDHAEHEADATASAVLSGAPAQRRADDERD
ncbi:MAG: DUF4157 domain-containing protein [Hyphomicrobiales bacterium]